MVPAAEIHSNDGAARRDDGGPVKSFFLLTNRGTAIGSTPVTPIILVPCLSLWVLEGVLCVHYSPCEHLFWDVRVNIFNLCYRTNSDLIAHPAQKIINEARAGSIARVHSATKGAC